MSAEERLAALLHNFDGDDCLHHDDTGYAECRDRARALIAAGVSVPTEPGAPDPAECAICGDYTVGGVEVHAACLPAPEPSARLRALNLERLERFIHFDDRTSGKPRPYYVTANGIRQEMPRRFHADALALRAALAATPQDPEA